MTVALITGASSGIGLELARLLAADGHDLALVARREDQLRALAEEVGADRVRVVVVDLSRPGAAASVRDQVPEVDVLVNNAGIGDFGPFVDADPAKTVGMIQLNVTSLTELTRAYLPAMAGRGAGRILNTASTAAFQPGPLMAVYYATKAYVLSFSEALAEEVRGSGVTVTALCPGPTASGFQARADMEASNLVRGKKLPTARAVAEVGHRAMLAGDPVVVVGARNKVLAASIRLTPRPVVRRMVHRMQRAG